MSGDHNMYCSANNKQEPYGYACGGAFYFNLEDMPKGKTYVTLYTKPQYRELSDEEIKAIENSVKYSELALSHDEYMTKFAHLILKKASEK